MQFSVIYYGNVNFISHADVCQTSTCTLVNRSAIHCFTITSLLIGNVIATVLLGIDMALNPSLLSQALKRPA